MKKSKERLDAEATHELTWKSKLDNFWFYYRWFIIGGGCALLLVVIFIRDVTNNVPPDYQVALLTPGYVSEETRLGLEQIVTDQADDRNGDGQVLVTLMYYQMSMGGEEMPADPMAQMAATTRLAADLQEAESLLFITDRVSEYHTDSEMFVYNDGTAPPEGATFDESKMGVPLADCPAFASVLNAEQLESLKGFKLVKRAVPAQRLEKKPELVERLAASDALFAALTA